MALNLLVNGRILMQEQPDPWAKAASCRYSAWAEWAKTCSVTPSCFLVELV
jgi:hypothetical protein